MGLGSGSEYSIEPDSGRRTLCMDYDAFDHQPVSSRIVGAILSIGTVVFRGWARVMDGASSTRTNIWDSNNWAIG
jgi:hypothetical protein